MGKSIKKCDHCGAKMVEYRHTINKNMASILMFMAKNDGKFVLKEHNHKFTHNQLCNKQKMRYWELLANERHSGFWELTQYGWEFVSGLKPVHKWVWTYRGEAVRLEGPLVFITDLGYENYRRRDDYVVDQGSLF